MKKTFFFGIGLGVIGIMLMVSACHDLSGSNNTADEPVTATSAPSNNSAIATLLEKTPVRLFDGVELGDIGMSFEERVQKLTAGISRKAGRTIQDTDTIALTADDIAAVLESELENLEIPELLNPTEEDIAAINLDFPGLTEEEIVAELETIRRIYQDEVSALAFADILDNPAYQSVDSTPDRKIGYSNGAFYYNDSQLTAYEIGAMLSHPFSAITLSKQREKAMQLTERYMGAKDRVDDKSDAFRHSILSIVMAKDGWGLKGEKMAWSRDFTTAHEKGVKYIGIPSEMDLHNNKVGLRYYDAKSSKRYTRILFWKIETGVSEPSYDTACSAMKSKAISAVFIDRNLSDAKNRINAVSADSLVYINPDNHRY